MVTEDKKLTKKKLGGENISKTESEEKRRDDKVKGGKEDSTVNELSTGTKAKLCIAS